jgi:hypothetical protein
MPNCSGLYAPQMCQFNLGGLASKWRNRRPREIGAQGCELRQ